MTLSSDLRQLLLLLLVLLLTLILSACSTTSTIVTKPPGAKVNLSGRYLGRSPVEVKLTDGFVDDANYWVKVKKEGYKTQDFKLEQRWSPGYIILDVVLCIPTLGLGCYLVWLNGKTHQSEYVIPLEPISMFRWAPPAREPPGDAVGEPLASWQSQRRATSCHLLRVPCQW